MPPLGTHTISLHLFMGPQFGRADNNERMVCLCSTDGDVLLMAMMATATTNGPWHIRHRRAPYHLTAVFPHIHTTVRGRRQAASSHVGQLGNENKLRLSYVSTVSLRHRQHQFVRSFEFYTHKHT